MRAGRVASLFCLIGALLIAPASAVENAGAWRVIQSSEFRQGFVAGIASYLLNQSEGTMRAGYAECLAGRTDLSLLGVVDVYMERHPETADYTSDVAVTMALTELCAPYVPRGPVMPP
jgi:hypothetical protein